MDTIRLAAEALHTLSRRAFAGDSQAIDALAAEGLTVVGALSDGARFHPVGQPQQILTYRYGPQAGQPRAKDTHWGRTQDGRCEWNYDGREPVVLVGARS